MKKGKITFTMIKPGAVNNEFIGPILKMINDSGFKIIAMKMIQLRKWQAVDFYEIHREKPFFRSLVDFMTSGAIIVAILEKENAIEDYRNLIGATDPEKAIDGTIRKMFAESIEKNAVHGSDSDKNAIKECDFFFSRSERFTKRNDRIYNL